MEKINHEFFGELDLVNGLGDEIDFGDDTIVLWEEEYKGVMTTLWYDGGFEFRVEILDIFAEFLNNRDIYLNNAKEALESYLKEDDEYIVFHREEAELDIPCDIAEFVNEMTVNAVAFWAGENFISIDFMIAPDESDEILCVKLNDKLEIEDIGWES